MLKENVYQESSQSAEILTSKQNKSLLMLEHIVGKSKLLPQAEVKQSSMTVILGYDNYQSFIWSLSCLEIYMDQNFTLGTIRKTRFVRECFAYYFRKAQYNG